jgi:hypothetical protein
MSGLQGQIATAREVFRSHDYVFFTCGCEPCAMLATRLRGATVRAALVGDLSRVDIADFARKTKWKGSVWLDEGARLQIALKVGDCPRLYRWRDGVPVETSVADISRGGDR